MLCFVCTRIDRLAAILARGALASQDNSPKSAESPAELLGFLEAEPSVEARLRHGVRGASGRRRLPEFTPGKLGESYDVRERGSTAADNGEVGDRSVLLFFLLFPDAKGLLFWCLHIPLVHLHLNGP